MNNPQLNSATIVTSGKRKRAVAKARIKIGTGRLILNNIPYENLNLFHKLALKEPVEMAKKILNEFNYDIEVTMNGGGQEGQIESARLAIAKAIIAFTKSAELKRAFLNYDKNLLVADVRRKEPYKPGDSKARAKRQKSFR